MLLGRVEGAEPPPDAPREADERWHVKGRFPSKGVDQNAAQGIGDGGADGIACEMTLNLSFIKRQNVKSRASLSIFLSAQLYQKPTVIIITPPELHRADNTHSCPVYFYAFYLYIAADADRCCAENQFLRAVVADAQLNTHVEK